LPFYSPVSLPDGYFLSTRKGVPLNHNQLEKRFGVTAVEMGFITGAQLHEAMAMQLDENLRGLEHRLIGQILLKKGYISSIQIIAVLDEMGFPRRFYLCEIDKGAGLQATGKAQT
jgi:hypothetical protein